jgi:hypothetical protein
MHQPQCGGNREECKPACVEQKAQVPNKSTTRPNNYTNDGNDLCFAANPITTDTASACKQTSRWNVSEQRDDFVKAVNAQLEADRDTNVKLPSTISWNVPNTSDAAKDRSCQVKAAAERRAAFANASQSLSIISVGEYRTKTHGHFMSQPTFELTEALESFDTDDHTTHDADVEDDELEGMSHFFSFRKRTNRKKRRERFSGAMKKPESYEDEDYNNVKRNRKGGKETPVLHRQEETNIGLQMDHPSGDCATIVHAPLFHGESACYKGRPTNAT